MKRGTHKLAPGHENIEGGFVREFMLLLNGISVEEKSREIGFTPVIYVTRLSSLCKRLTSNQHAIWQHSGHAFVCKGCGMKFKTNNSKLIMNASVNKLIYLLLYDENINI